MERILERYERYSYASKELVAADPESQECLSTEYNKLKSKVESLQRSQRHFMGEDISGLALKELQSLEQQFDTALRNIRSRKNQLMYGTITELQRNDRALVEENNNLKKQVKEMELTLTLTDRQIHVESSPFVPVPEPIPTINTSGTSQSSGIEGGEVVIQPPHAKSSMPPWMLPHINEEMHEE
ncbi:Floral homeotic protein APETALA [Ranunculus cassubicifolius]